MYSSPVAQSVRTLFPPGQINGEFTISYIEVPLEETDLVGIGVFVGVCVGVGLGLVLVTDIVNITAAGRVVEGVGVNVGVVVGVAVGVAVFVVVIDGVGVVVGVGVGVLVGVGVGQLLTSKTLSHMSGQSVEHGCLPLKIQEPPKDVDKHHLLPS